MVQQTWTARPGKSTGYFYIPILNLPSDVTGPELKEFVCKLDGKGSPCTVVNSEVLSMRQYGWVQVRGEDDFWRAYAFLRKRNWRGKILSPSSKNYDEELILEPVPHHLTANPEIRQYTLYICRTFSETQCLQLGFRALQLMGLTAWIVDCHPAKAREVPAHDEGNMHGHTVLVVQAEESAEFVMGRLKGVTLDGDTVESLEFFLAPEGVTEWCNGNQESLGDDGGWGMSSLVSISSNRR